MSGEQPESGTSGAGIGSWLAISLALVALGIATYPAYELYRRDTDDAQLAAKLSALEAQLSVRDAQLDELTQGIEESGDQDQAVFDAKLGEFAEGIETELAAIRGRLSTSSEDWLFAEVEYLLRMANQRVLMEKDTASALQLLLAADDIVRDAEGISAHELRAALARDIAALKAVAGLDTQGIYLKISALISQIPDLQRELPHYETTAASVEQRPVPASLPQRAMVLLSDAGHRLSGLVDFRRGEAEVRPILPPEQVYYLRQNLVLKLQIAQMALLEGHGEVYQVSLNEARTWLIRSFDDDATRQAMVATLVELGTERVGEDLPDIFASLNAARVLLADFNKGSTE